MSTHSVRIKVMCPEVDYCDLWLVCHHAKPHRRILRNYAKHGSCEAGGCAERRSAECVEVKGDTT